MKTTLTNEDGVICNPGQMQYQILDHRAWAISFILKTYYFQLELLCSRSVRLIKERAMKNIRVKYL